MDVARRGYRGFRFRIDLIATSPLAASYSASAGSGVFREDERERERETFVVSVTRPASRLD